MKNGSATSPFISSEAREKAATSLEEEIRRLEAEINAGYLRLGRQVSEMAERENEDINEKVDRVVELKRQMRGLRETDGAHDQESGE